MEMEEEREWEKLERDCLVEILSRVGIESLVFHIPKVCKSWCGASLDPTCWRNLNIPEHKLKSWDRDRSRVETFIKFVVDRSETSATSIHLSFYCSPDLFEYVSNRCPYLKVLNLPEALLLGYPNMVLKALENWKNLEELSVGSNIMLAEIVTQIKIHCKKFVALNCSSFAFDDEEAAAIVELMPKKLSIKNCWLPDDILVMILKSNKGLEVLDVRKSYGYRVDDETLKLASHIKTFRWRAVKYEAYLHRNKNDD